MSSLYRQPDVEDLALFKSLLVLILCTRKHDRFVRTFSWLLISNEENMTRIKQTKYSLLIPFKKEQKQFSKQVQFRWLHISVMGNNPKRGKIFPFDYFFFTSLILHCFKSILLS